MTQEPTPDRARSERLLVSGDMRPIAGTVEVAIPVGEFWRCFAHPNLWARWNRCFFWAWNRELVLGRRLVWVFQPIRSRYLYKMPAVATIVELEPERRVTWEVTALPGFYARHTYHLEDLGGGRSRFGTWEQAMGPTLRLTRGFWLAHFTFVMQRSLEGAQALQQLYNRQRSLDLAGLDGTGRRSLTTVG